MSYLIDADLEHEGIKARIKQCVAVEYVPVSENSMESSLNVLIQHKDSFEWMDIQYAIPVGSEREYADPKAVLADLASKQLASIKRKPTDPS